MMVNDVKKLAAERDFNAIETGRFVTVVSELASNIVKYAGRGFIDIEEVEEKDRSGFTVTAIDRGKGIADVDKALQDSFSTSGTLGLGLPGVKRISDEFFIESESTKGVKVVSTILREKKVRV